jgi:hypothetical protein
VERGSRAPSLSEHHDYNCDRGNNEYDENDFATMTTGSSTQRDQRAEQRGTLHESPPSLAWISSRARRSQLLDITNSK